MNISAHLDIHFDRERIVVPCDRLGIFEIPSGPVIDSKLKTKRKISKSIAE